MAALLIAEGCEVEVLQSDDHEPEPLYRQVIADTMSLGAKCHFVRPCKAPSLEHHVIKAARKFRIVYKLGIVYPEKIRLARQVLRNSGPFDRIITYEPASLFLADQALSGSLDRVIHYSLEIIDETHPDFHTNCLLRAFRLYERRTLSKVRALLIQDRFRARILTAKAPGNVRKIYFPVAMSNRPAAQAGARRGWPLTEQQKTAVKVLFFGDSGPKISWHL